MLGLKTNKRLPPLSEGSFHFLTVQTTPHMEEYIVQAFPLDFLFHLDPTDLPMEEHKRPLGFSRNSVKFSRYFSTPLDFYFHTSMSSCDILIPPPPRIFLLNFQSTIRIFSSISIFYSFACPLDFFFHLGCIDKWNDPRALATHNK